MRFSQIIIFICFFSVCFSIYDILNYGAVPKADSVPDHFRNQRAILSAIADANRSSGERIIRIPAKTFYSMPIRVENARNITFLILGKLAASKNVRQWPRQAEIPTYFEDFISFHNC